LMYELLPGVSLFRRPADGSFVLGALLAVVAGYLVHRWLQGTVAPSSRPQCALDMACALILVGAALLLAHSVVAVRPALLTILTAVIFTCAGSAVLVMAQRVNAHHPLAAVALIAGFMTADLGWNNAPHVSTALPPARFGALRQDTGNATVQLIRSRLAASAASDRRDRVELIGIGYHWPNLGLVHGFDHVFGQNPLRFRDFKQATGVGDTVAIPEQRRFSPLFPPYRSAFADLFGVRVIATGVPIEQIDKALKAGDLAFLARTKDAYVYENPRALPRVMVMTDWRLADFDELMRTSWPDVDPARTVLLEHPPEPRPAAGSETRAGAARIVRYGNAEIIVDVEAPAGGFLLLTDIWH